MSYIPFLHSYIHVWWALRLPPQPRHTNKCTYALFKKKGYNLLWNHRMLCHNETFLQAVPLCQQEARSACQQSYEKENREDLLSRQDRCPTRWMEDLLVLQSKLKICAFKNRFVDYIWKRLRRAKLIMYFTYNTFLTVTTTKCIADFRTTGLAQ